MDESIFAQAQELPTETSLQAVKMKDHEGNMVESPNPSFLLHGVQVLGAMNKAGKIVGVDGREFLVANSDLSRLVARLNSQSTKARIDFDHRSERLAYGYVNEPISSVVCGWAGNYRVENNKMICDLELNHWAGYSVKEKVYRYLSPAITVNRKMEIQGITSVALVNNPNFKMSALNRQEKNVDPSNEENSDMSDKTAEQTTQELNQLKEQLANAEAEKAEVEKEKAALLTAQLNSVVEAAIESGQMLAAEKDTILEVGLNHSQGLGAGIASVEKILNFRGKQFTDLTKKIVFPAIYFPRTIYTILLSVSIQITYIVSKKRPPR